jgi:histidyl-tRNA synthetase
MVAAKRRELSFPLRWYSIPNLFRYERPQRGRLREHWQLNVDMFGLLGMEADTEIISIAYHLLKQFGLADSQFAIHIHSRILLNELFGYLELSTQGRHELSKLIDRKAKMEAEEFAKNIEQTVAEPEKRKVLEAYLNARDLDELPSPIQEGESAKKMKAVFAIFAKNGIANITFDATIVRGFDYYTGTVFEVFDTSPQNNRSLFGGGRYDDLLDIFGQEKVPAAGFGMGDVTIRDVLDTYNLIPEHVRSSKTQLYICTMGADFAEHATMLAEKLRVSGVRVAVDYTYKKVGDQIAKASKDGIPFVVCVGEEEVEKRLYKLKYLPTQKEELCDEDALILRLRH